MKKLLAIILTITIVFFIATPNITEWQKSPFPESIIVFDANEKPLYWQGPPYRNNINYNNIPKLLIEAFRTTEDHRFFFHNGIDWIAFARAIKHLIRTGKKDIGASTITMQLARNAFLSPEKTYSRKIIELIIAIKIDAILNKHEIMELYLNKIYFGNGAHGIAAAAWRYYGKNISELTLPETAMIAGLPQAPSKNNPIARPNKALYRRNFVLKKLFKHKIIKLPEYQAAINTPITAKLNKWPKINKYKNLIKYGKKIYLPPRKFIYD